MGGRALSDLGAQTRLPTARMAAVADAAAAAVGAKRVRSLRGKPDHGDADLVLPASIAVRLDDATLAGLVGDAVGVPSVHRRADPRDPILTIGLRMPEGLFQVDLLSSPDDLVDFAARELSWGDLGAMIGRTARAAGVAFGQNGLRLPVHLDGVGRESVLLTTDFARALDFLGWDPARHDAGFEGPRDVADYVASGSMFDPAVYDPERATSDARRKTRARLGQSALLDDLRSRPGRMSWPARTPNPASEATVEAALRIFGAHDALDAAEERLRLRARRSDTVVTMDAVVAATGCDPSDARAVLAVVKEDFPGAGAFPRWKADADADDVATRAVAAHAVLRKRRAAQAAEATRSARP